MESFKRDNSTNIQTAPHLILMKGLVTMTLELSISHVMWILSRGNCGLTSSSPKRAAWAL